MSVLDCGLCCGFNILGGYLLNLCAMTDERKQAEDFIRAKYYLPKELPNELCFFHEKLFELMEEYASLKVAEATKEMYPEAYTRWLFWNEYYMTEEGLFSPVKKMPKGTLNELFEYWKQNIRK